MRNSSLCMVCALWIVGIALLATFEPSIAPMPAGDEPNPRFTCVTFAYGRG